MPEQREITILLKEIEDGRDGALDDLMRVVYDDLEGMARGHLHRQFGAGVRAITLEPAALVNESFMRLIRQRSTYDNRGHFFAIATRLMLRVLIDYRRERGAEKRGGDAPRVTLSMAAAASDAGDEPVAMEIEFVASALAELEELSARKADVVKMRAIWGLSNDETARSLGVSPSTVERDWRFARAWLVERVGPVETEQE